MTELHSLKITIPNDMVYLDIVENFAAETAKKFGFEKTQIGQIELAVEESVANVIKHAFEPGELNTFDVICEQIPLGMKIIVKDKGLPFDPGQLAQYDAEKIDGRENAPGLGLFLMKSAMDQVSFVNLGMEGKETHLIKYLPKKNIEEYYPGRKLDVEKAPPAAKVITEKIPYDVRRMQANEAIEVSKCAYKSHGYTFFDDVIYFPDRLVALNNSEELISLVAVTMDNIFMGHSALHYPYLGASIAELTYCFVNMEYRGQGCLTRLIEQLFRTEKKYPLTGIYVNSVTNHVFTQKVVVKYGVNDCGIYLAASPGTWVFKGISGESKQRLSVVLGFKYLNPAPELTLYAPAAHREMIEKLYCNIGGKPGFAVPQEGQTRPRQEKSVITVNVFESENCAEVWVDSFGSDLVKQIKHTLFDLKSKQVGAIYIYLSLEKPEVYSAAPQLEELGFFFSGVLPQTQIGDTLILQYLNNIALDYGQIQILTDMGKQLLCYIKERDTNLIAR